MPNVITIDRSQTTQPTPAQKLSASQRLEHARGRLQRVQRSVSASEGRLLDFEVAEEMQRFLGEASRELCELAITVAVLERSASR